MITMNKLTSAGLTLRAEPRPQTRLVKRGFRAMGSEMIVALQTGAPLAWLLLDQVHRWFEDWEQKFSRFRDDSELNRLNRSSGQSVPVSSDMWQVLRLALSSAEATQGLVTPTVLAALESAGYDRTFSALGEADADQAQVKASPEDVLMLALSKPGDVLDWRQIRLEPQDCSVWLPQMMRLDFGGVAKGWAADRAAQELGAMGPTLVDAGGDIAVSGPMLDGSAWPVGIANPFAQDQDIGLLRIFSGGVATSGRDYRRWRHGAHEMHHIIDPRTGKPAQTDLLSVTVVGPSAVAAEAAAKAVLILGSVEGLQWIERRPELAALVVRDAGGIIQSPTFDRYIWS